MSRTDETDERGGPTGLPAAVHVPKPLRIEPKRRNLDGKDVITFVLGNLSVTRNLVLVLLATSALVMALGWAGHALGVTLSLTTFVSAAGGTAGVAALVGGTALAVRKRADRPKD